MEETEVKFEPSGRNGIVPVGCYVIDAAKRLGEEIENEREEQGTYDVEKIKITSGAELLSEPTKIEIEHLTPQERNEGARLAGQARIEKSGELVIMVAKKKEEKTEQTPEEKMEDFQKEFSELPLEKKVANLLQMEVATLSETFSFILNSPSAIVSKAMDVMAEFGLKMEKDAKNSKRPAEHAAESTESENGSGDKTEPNQAKSKKGNKRKENGNGAEHSNN